MRNSRSLVLQAYRRAASAARGLAFVLGLATVVGTSSAQAQTFTVVHTFRKVADGAEPTAGVISDAKGNLYGTTSLGGDRSCNAPDGCGVVFKLSSKGKETVLHSFTGGADGATPDSELLMDAKGNLYGTTQLGGDSTCTVGGYFGCGVVFKLSLK
jgi:uncharacterized repeat protein (TIGR03803 family)